MQITVFFTFLVFTFFFMRKHREDVDKREFKDKFGAFVTNIETFKKPRAAFYPFIFLLRRFFIALALVFLKEYIVF